MALKTGIFSLALGTLLIGSSALADDTQQLQAQQDASKVEAQGFRGGSAPSGSWGNGNDSRYGGNDSQYRGSPAPSYPRDGRYRRSPPPAPQYQQGRYELKSVQQWVPGSYQQVWVPEDCSYRGRRGRSQCTGGYYDQRWVEGHYTTVEQWVWVPARWHQGTPVVYYRY